MLIGIVEDNKEDSKTLEKMLGEYQQETGLLIQVRVFQTGAQFLDAYHGEFDLVFLDIKMPGISGMQTARELRDLDDSVGIIFTTNLAQYALQGYEVEAIDFIVKPISPFILKRKMDKARRILSGRQEGSLLVNTENGIVRLRASEIHYVEKNKNYLCYHTEKGEIKERGTIKELKNRLEGYGFAECISGCLVNLKYVSYIESDRIRLGGDVLPISRGMRKSFMMEYLKFIGDRSK
ncbi:MAG: response regulator transcription factor [Blautia sp.]|nr:response regulator transcription factor [Blautia sp.]